MDPLTQGILGAVLPQSMARRAEQRLAALGGGLAAMSADLDVLIRSGDDPLLTLDFHRHFSHALAFIPTGGLLTALLLWLLPAVRRRLGFARLLLFTTLGYATAGLLDACTGYGTQLYWPFSDQRVAWNIISIVDPLMTLPMLLGLGLALKRRNRGLARLSLAFGVTYLVLGIAQRDAAEDFTRQLADSRGHQIERLLVKPTLGNRLLWRSIYQADGRYHVDALRLGPQPRVYAGGSVPVFSRQRSLPGLKDDSLLANDIRRFTHASDGYLVDYPGRPGVIGDVRYAMLPNAMTPIWGIVYAAGHPGQHVDFQVYRERGNWQLFVDMLLGRPLAPPAATES